MTTIDISFRRAAVIAGTAILAMAILAAFAYGFVLNRLIIPVNADLTAGNIIASETLFRAAIFSFLLVLICDVLAAWSLNVFLKRVSKELSLLAAWLRIIYAGILGVAILCFTTILLLLPESGYLKVFGHKQVSAIMLLLANAFNSIWAAGLVVFGFHLLILGYLVLKSGYVPKVFGVLLIIASLCYVVSNSTSLLFSSYEAYKGTVEMFLSLPMIIGELGFGIWLLLKGGKVAITTETPVHIREFITNPAS
jgi:hypothetical protein